MLFGIHLVMIIMSLFFYVLLSSLCVSICEGNAAVSNVGDLRFCGGWSFGCCSCMEIIGR